MERQLNADTRYVAMDNGEVVREFRSYTEASRWLSKGVMGADIKQVIHGAIVDIPEGDEPPYSPYSRNPLYDIMAEDDDEEVE